MPLSILYTILPKKPAFFQISLRFCKNSWQIKRMDFNLANNIGKALEHKKKCLLQFGAVYVIVYLKHIFLITFGKAIHFSGYQKIYA